jgi:hypothetical protein
MAYIKLQNGTKIVPSPFYHFLKMPQNLPPKIPKIDCPESQPGSGHSFNMVEVIVDIQEINI